MRGSARAIELIITGNHNPGQHDRRVLAKSAFSFWFFGWSKHKPVGEPENCTTNGRWEQRALLP
jgi:hypothetical protein